MKLDTIECKEWEISNINVNFIIQYDLQHYVTSLFNKNTNEIKKNIEW
jgi:hypothetical protein